MGALFHQGHVEEFLAGTQQQWDAIYSVWGAVWFNDPRVPLPLIHDRLESGGRLVFSHAELVPGARGPQGMYGVRFRGRRVWLYQWTACPEEWEELFASAGFEHSRVWVEPAPEADHVGTLIGVAYR